MCAKKCCPVWTVITVILVIVAIVVAVCVVLKKLHLLGNAEPDYNVGYWSEDKKAEVENGVRFTTDQDFV